MRSLKLHKQKVITEQLTSSSYCITCQCDMLKHNNYVCNKIKTMQEHIKIKNSEINDLFTGISDLQAEVTRLEEIIQEYERRYVVQRIPTITTSTNTGNSTWDYMPPMTPIYKW